MQAVVLMEAEEVDVVQVLEIEALLVPGLGT
jgi:hypothetical protein